MNFRLWLENLSPVGRPKVVVDLKDRWGDWMSMVGKIHGAQKEKGWYKRERNQFTQEFQDVAMQPEKWQEVLDRWVVLV